MQNQEIDSTSLGGSNDSRQSTTKGSSWYIVAKPLKTYSKESQPPTVSFNITEDEYSKVPPKQSKSVLTPKLDGNVTNHNNPNITNQKTIDPDEDTEDLITKLSLFTEIDEDNYSCELCALKDIQSIFKQKTLIIRHLLRAHSYSHDYECSSCQDTFRRKHQLENHVTSKHPESFKTIFFECTQCVHKAKNENLMKLHKLRKHAADYKYVCKYTGKCFKSFKAKAAYEKMVEKCVNAGNPIKSQPSHVWVKYDETKDSKDDLARRLKEIFMTHSDKLNPKPTFICKICGVAFLTETPLIKHIQTHPDWKSIALSKESKKPLTNESVECEECGKMLSSKDHLKKHELTHSGEKPHKCFDCGRTFALRSTMRVHALSHAGIKPYVCDMCGLGYSQRSALMMHWKSKHKGMPAPPAIEISHYFDKDGRVCLPCKRLSARGIRKQSVISRIRVRTALELLTFQESKLEEIMPQRRKSSSSLEESSLNMPKVEPVEVKKEPLMYRKLKNDNGFVCKMCHQKFSHRHKVKQHIKLKHKPRVIYSCVDCNKNFKSKYQFVFHSNQHRENSSDYLFCCDKCEYRAKSKHYLKTHMIRKHTTDTNFECDNCGRRFKMKMDLKSHLSTHSDSQHMCDACGKMYTSQDSLNKHRRVVHLNEYKYKCSICRQKLLTKENYDSHMRSHEKMHTCDECDLKFTKKYYVTRHKKRVHKVEKTNLCPVCGKAFVCMSTLRVHYLTHAKVKPYLCNVCGFSFTQRSSMMLHWKKKHPDAEEPPPPVILTNFFDSIQNQVNEKVAERNNDELLYPSQ